MKISTKGRYGLRAMLDLAVFGTAGHVAMRSIAIRQGISENYLEQVFSSLKKAALVRSIKGAQGGYALIDDPDKVRIGTILRVLEGDLAVMEEMEEPPPTRECRQIRCALQKHVWDPMNAGVNQVVDSQTLADLAREYQELLEQNVPMYYI